MGININELNQQPLDADLLSGFESIMGSLRVLSKEELSLSGGDGYGYGKGYDDDDDHGKGKGKRKGKGKGHDDCYDDCYGKGHY